MPSPWQTAASFGRTLASGVAHLVYPNTCWTCGVLMPPEQGPLCATCNRAITVDPFPTCPRCSRTVGPNLELTAGCPACQSESLAFDGALGMAPYEGLLRDTILRMKHWAGAELAEVIGALWATQMSGRVQPLQPDVIVPVPLHWTRRFMRGFNQCDVFARQLGKCLAVPVWHRALRRIRATPHQTAQESATARRENVKHAFEAGSGFDMAGKTVLIVDDVMTTGATVNEAARALSKAKPKAIFVVVLAHGR